jgi:hypothetical protein
MAKTKHPRRKANGRKPPSTIPETKRTPLQAWVEKEGHGAQSKLAQLTDLRWQTIHDLVVRNRNAQLPTAKLIEEATEGAVPWESLLANRIKKTPQVGA